MARTCTVCAHPAHHRLNKLVVEGQESLRSIAHRHGLSKDALIRHRKAHIPKALVKAQEATEIAHGEDLLGQLRGLQAQASQILEEAANSGDLRTALMAVREARGCMELIAKATGELVERHAHLHVRTALPPDAAQRFGEILKEHTEQMKRVQPIIRERVMRHVFVGEDAVPPALVGDGRK